ncbi:MAG: acetyl-CoA carboxylase, carboxyltransferase subunit beta [Clostridiales bacterium]|nr:acetyl-CoA carboxylase, carboxyltransferase subunit beta [Clostridiales bacterium]
MTFKKPRNLLEGYSKLIGSHSEDSSDDLMVTCPKCKKSLASGDLLGSINVCMYCGHHFRMNARQRLNLICDRDTFAEADGTMVSSNLIGFPEYDGKLENARLDSKEPDAVICGACKINGIAAGIFVMEPYFMMGSMGVVVGEKLTRLFERAAAERLPVVGFTVSGGARMQEGILSLMQMAKVSGAVKRHSDAGLFFVCVLTDPTTGGVTASFAMEADVIAAEPFAHIGFAGARVIEQTMRKKLPEGFQRAEFLLEKGFIDDIVERKKQKKYLAQLLKMHVR